MANKNFEVKHGLSVGGTERISSAGVGTFTDLNVTGTTTTIDTANLQVKDKNIVLNYGTGDTSSTANGAGITIQDGVNSSTDATILWDGSNDEFDFSHTVTAPSLTVSGNATFDSSTLAVDSTNNRVGIGIASPDSQLHVHGVGTLLSSDSYFVAQIQTDRNDDGSNDDGILQFVNGSAKTVKGEIRWDESTNTFELGHGDNQGHLVIASGGNVGIGTTAPFSKLSINSNGAPATSTGNMATTGLTIHDGTGGTGVQLGTYNAGSWGYIQSGYVNNATVAREFRIMNGANYTMTLSSTGNVGIGTTSPLVKTHVHNGSDAKNIVLITGADTTSEYLGLGTESGIGYITSGSSSSDNTSLAFRYAASGVETEAMRINSSGNVGIGTSPLSNNKLHVNGTVHIGNGADYSSYAKLAVYDDVYQGDVGLLIKNDRYNDSSATASLIFEHRTHAGQGHAAKIVCRRQGAYNESSGSKDAALDFYTANGGTYSHRMQIDRDGRVGIGTGTSGISYPFIVQSGTTDQQLRLANASSNISTMHAGFGCNPSTDITIQTQGHGVTWRFGSNVSNANAYWINSNNVGVTFGSGSNAWSAHSDERLKENITDIGPVLDKIQNYRCVSFNFKSSPEKELIGFIAQDWETDFPEVVDEDDAFTIQDDGSLVEKNKEENTSDIKVKSIAYTETIPVLLKAIQELKIELDAAKARIATLEG